MSQIDNPGGSFGGVLPVANGGTGVTISPTCSVTRGGANQTGVAQNTFTKVQFTTEEFDNNNNFDNATNFRFTPTVAGKYLVSSQVVMVGLASGKPLVVAIRKNGTGVKQGVSASVGYGSTFAAVTAPIDMNGSTDYLEIFAYHEDTVARDISGSELNTYFTATRVGA